MLYFLCCIKKNKNHQKKPHTPSEIYKREAANLNCRLTALSQSVNMYFYDIYEGNKNSHKYAKELHILLDLNMVCYILKYIYIYLFLVVESNIDL